MRTEVFVQWKGTDVCLDFHCVCGWGGHYDGDFAYNLRCAACGKLWEMPHTFTLTETEDDGSAIQDTDWSHDQRRTYQGPDVLTLVEEEEDDTPPPAQT